MIIIYDATRKESVSLCLWGQNLGNRQDRPVPYDLQRQILWLLIYETLLNKKKIIIRHTFSSWFSPNVPINFNTTPVDLPCNIFAPMFSIRDFKLRIFHDDWFEIVSILSARKHNLLSRQFLPVSKRLPCCANFSQTRRHGCHGYSNYALSLSCHVRKIVVQVDFFANKIRITRRLLLYLRFIIYYVPGLHFNSQK